MEVTPEERWEYRRTWKWKPRNLTSLSAPSLAVMVDGSTAVRALMSLTCSRLIASSI